MDGTGKLLARFAAVCPAETVTIAYPNDRLLGYDALENWIELPREPSVLIGESFSGPLALRLAVRFPDRVFAVVMAASFIAAPRFIPPFPPFVFARKPPRFILRRWLTGGDDSLVDELTAVAAAVDPRVFALRLREVRKLDAASKLVECPRPILYLAARRDRVVDPGTGVALKQIRADLEHETIDAPHLLLQTRPHDVAQAIASFLRRHHGSAA
jgi:pimeloyl-ACP methyl ester carboxylesterase